MSHFHSFAIGAVLLCTAWVPTYAQGTLNALPAKILQPSEPPDVRLHMQFGAAASAISGSTLLVGAPETDGHGAVYVYTLTGGVWKQTSKIVAPDIAPGTFGSQVELEGGHAFISDRARRQVYAFFFENGRWKPRAILKAGVEGFGAQIRLRGCAALVTSTTDILSGPAPTQPGYVHVFNRCVKNDGSWTYITSFHPPGSKPADHFGAGIAFEGTTLFVGAPGEDNHHGAAYHYRYENHGWVLKQRLNLFMPHQAGDRHFGLGLAVRGTLLVVGSPSTPVNFNTTGNVHYFNFKVFEEFGTEFWSHCCTFNPVSESPAWQNFGSRIVITPRHLLVSGPAAGDSENVSHVFVFKRILGGEGEAPGEEIDLYGERADGFGADISATNSAFVAGRPFYRTRPDSSEGLAYIYALPPD